MPSSLPADCDVLVIGAGISGLVAAFELQARGLHVEVLEAAAQPGGVIATRERDGALFEQGPNSTRDTSPLIGTLLDRLGIGGERIEAAPAAMRRFVVRNGRLEVLPSSPGTFLTTAAFSVRAKLRLLREPFIPRGPAASEESIAAFTRRRLGKEALDYAIEPFVAGIYAGDAEQISVAAAFPRLYALEQRYGSVVKGQLRQRRERARTAATPHSAAGSFSFKRGMQTLPDALARALRHVQLGTSVIGLARDGDGSFRVTAQCAAQRWQRRARAVVLALPADAAAGLVGAFDAAAAQALAHIPYAPIAVVASLYPRAALGHALDGFGFLVPGVEHRRILGTLFSSSMFAGRARAGTALLTTFAGGQRNPEVCNGTDGIIAGTVAAELEALVEATQPPLWQEVTRRARAIPQYTLGHLARLAELDNAEARLPGLFFCANYRGGVAVGECIAAAHAMARRVAEHTRAPR